MNRHVALAATMRFSHVFPLVAVAALLAACGDEGTDPSNSPSNTAPTAAFAAQCNPLTCTFANSSTDTDGTIEGYDWDFGDHGPHVTTRDAVHTYPAPGGRFTVTLTVTDDDGETATATREVDASEANVAPTADFTVSCTDLTCTFSDGSSDGNVGGSVASYAWDFGDGETSTEANPVHGYAATGHYLVALTVTDDVGATGTVSRRIPVPAAPGPPGAFPPVPAGALTYVRVSAEASGAKSRYVLYEDSTFALQYLTTSFGFFEYTGRYARVNASISLDFDASRPQWQATATYQGDSLVVTYNLDMALSGFEDGVYRVAPTITILPLPPVFVLCYPAIGGNRPCPSTISVAISNTGGGTLNWTSSKNGTWLRRSPPVSGTAPSTMKFSVDGTGLPLGTYSGWIKVSATGATNSPQMVTVIMRRR